MGSHAQDQKTQTAASAGAQQNDAVLDANAAQNQAFANQARTTLFGTYNPATNQYAGGTQSSFLNPSTMDTKNLTGSYANEFNHISDTNAQAAQRAVGTTTENLNSRGMGATPAGFAADLQRKAYQDQANNNGAAYANLFGQQHGEDVAKFQNANNLLNSNSTGAANLSLQGNQAAAGNYAGLYGTASQQVQSPWSTVLGAAGTLAGAGATAYAGRNG
jgi:hypothetical protein